MPAARITLAHFSVSSAMSLPKSVGEPASTVPPRATSCSLILRLASPALISLLSLSTISVGVFLGAPMPNQMLASKPGTNSPMVERSGRATATLLNASINRQARILPPGLLQQAQTEVRVGKTSALGEILGRVAAATNQKKNPQTLEDFVELAAALGRYQELLADFAGAVDTYQAALRLAPSSVRIAIALASNLIEGGRLPDALNV